MTTDLHLVLRLKMSGAVRLLPQYAFVARIGTTLSYSVLLDNVYFTLSSPYFTLSSPYCMCTTSIELKQLKDDDRLVSL